MQGTGGGRFKRRCAGTSDQSVCGAAVASEWAYSLCPCSLFERPSPIVVFEILSRVRNWAHRLSHLPLVTGSQGHHCVEMDGAFVSGVDTQVSTQEDRRYRMYCVSIAVHSSKSKYYM